jgi:hypothetical protein
MKWSWILIAVGVGYYLYGKKLKRDEYMQQQVTPAALRPPSGVDMPMTAAEAEEYMRVEYPDPREFAYRI